MDRKKKDVVEEKIIKNDVSFVPEKPNFVQITNQTQKKGCCLSKGN